jgi:lipopolysaccharide/colanic/teichoic acid biosynthesis glycosyltransferase
MYATNDSIAHDLTRIRSNAWRWTGTFPSTAKHRALVAPVKGSPLRRGLDLAIAICALVGLLPILALISLLIKLQDGGSVLFSQERIGERGRRFRCYKFRSMRPDAEARLAAVLAKDPELLREWAETHKLKNDPRVTLLGEFLRRSSLDELPQLINIIRGEMSVVGPRPIVKEEVARYCRWYRYYTMVKPGLTGLWQVSGRNDVNYRRRIAMDRLYVRMDSFQSYCWILVATVPAVLVRKGSY